MSEVTQLLLQWNSGDDEARTALIKLIYTELNQIASRHLSREGAAHDLYPNALVHECYLRLVDLDHVAWQGRAHFLAMAARLMRQILVDEARRRKSAKRDGGIQVTLSGISPIADQPTTNALELHEALNRLTRADPQRARLVELRYFGGLTIEETAEVMEISPATVKRSWEVARGWLYRELSGERAD